MTSNNVLWLGMLLFLLLVTSCVVHFIDTCNPNLTQIAQIESKPPEDLQIDPFSKDVQIDSFIGDELQKGLENLTIQSVNNDKNETNETNITKIPIKKEQPPIKIPNKIDKNIIVKKEVKNEKTKKRKKVLKEHVLKRDKRLLIESILKTREFFITKNAKLAKDDKRFLNKIAKTVKSDSSLIIKIKTAHITPSIRKYLQQIVKYLKDKGLKSSRIEIITESSKNKKNIVKINNKKNSVELLLTERI